MGAVEGEGEAEKLGEALVVGVLKPEALGEMEALWLNEDKALGEEVRVLAPSVLEKFALDEGGGVTEVLCEKTGHCVGVWER